MAKTRLRNDDRETIREAIIDHKFSPIEAALAAEAAALAIKARTRAYGDFAKVMDAAPAGAFDTTATVYVTVGGKRVGLAAGGQMRVFYAHRNGHNEALRLTDAEPLGVKIMDWASRSEANRTERQHLRRQVLATLSAFNTFDDLKAGWPEAERFITERWRTRPDYAANVPAVQIASLTAALDLPPETQAEAA
jgi:hypothetical protein